MKIHRELTFSLECNSNRSTIENRKLEWPPLFYLFPVFFLLSAPASLGIMIISMIKQETIRIYADTSVFGGVFDAEFEEPSKAFFDAIRAARFVLVSSELVRQKILAGP